MSGKRSAKMRGGRRRDECDGCRYEKQRDGRTSVQSVLTNLFRRGDDDRCRFINLTQSSLLPLSCEFFRCSGHPISWVEMLVSKFAFLGWCIVVSVRATSATMTVPTMAPTMISKTAPTTADVHRRSQFHEEQFVR